MADAILMGQSGGGLKINDGYERYVRLSENVNKGDTIVQVVPYKKIANPSILPTGRGEDVALSPDGVYAVVGHMYSPYISIYKHNVNQYGNHSYTKLSNPSVLPVERCDAVTFSNDGIYMVVCPVGGTPHLIYKRTGDTFAKIRDITDADAYPTKVAFSPNDSHLVISGGTIRLAIYKRSGDTFTKLSTPSVVPPSIVHDIAFSNDGLYMAVSHNTTPFVSVYKINGDTFTKLPNIPAPLYGSTSVAFTVDNKYLMTTHTDSRASKVYEINNDVFTNATFTLGMLARDYIRKIRFSRDGLYLGMAGGSSSMGFLSLEKYVGNSLSSIYTAHTQPPNDTNNLSFGGGCIGISSYASPYITFYGSDTINFVKGNVGVHRADTSAIALENGVIGDIIKAKIIY